jgi:hypothetical protein
MLGVVVVFLSRALAAGRCGRMGAWESESSRFKTSSFQEPPMDPI